MSATGSFAAGHFPATEGWKADSERRLIVQPASVTFTGCGGPNSSAYLLSLYHPLSPTQAGDRLLAPRLQVLLQPKT